MNKWMVAAILLAIIAGSLVMEIYYQTYYYEIGTIKIKKSIIDDFADKNNGIAKICNMQTNQCIDFIDIRGGG